MEKECPICKKMFRVFPSQKRVYCSVPCLQIGFKERFVGSGNPNFRHGRKNCEGCGKELSRNTKGDRCVKCRSLAEDYKNPFQGRKHGDDTRKKMSDNHADFSGSNGTFWGKHPTEAVRLEQSRTRKERWKNMGEADRRKILDALLRGVETMRSGVYTKPEKTVADILYDEDIEFEHNALLYEKFFVDFLLSDGTVIEVFGDYWHGNPEVFKDLTDKQRKQKIKDRSRVAYLKKCGHRVIVIWEKELKENPCIALERLFDGVSE